MLSASQVWGIVAGKGEGLLDRWAQLHSTVCGRRVESVQTDDFHRLLASKAESPHRHAG